MNAKSSAPGSSSKTSYGKRPLDETTLVSQLNDLLDSLHIPIPLISPTDLTPRLLIAILESLIGMRIPVIEREDNSHASKVQNMKVFLGVLETDIFQADVGLSQLDPRRLANGDWEEVVFVANLLCRIGRRMKLIKKDKGPQPPTERSPSRMPHHYEALGSHSLNSSVSSLKSTKSSRSAHSYRLSPKSQLDLDAASVFQTGSTTWDTRPSSRDISPFTTRLLDNESYTTVDMDDHQLLQPPFQFSHSNAKKRAAEDDHTLSSISDILPSLPQFPSFDEHESPHCIHEVQSPSFRLSPDILPSTPPRTSSRAFQMWCPEHATDSCTCDLSISPIQVPPVRYGGYIEEVDEDTEIASFELGRSTSRSSEFTSTSTNREIFPSHVKSVREQYTRTLELLNERTRLLTHLAQLKKNSYG